MNALLATVTTSQAAPVIVGQRLRTGSVGSPRGAGRMVADVLATVARLRSELRPDQARRPVLVRADSAFYGYPTIGSAVGAGADVSVTVRQTSTIKAAIAAIDQRSWTPIEYTDAVFDETAGRWISRAEVAEVPFIAFASQARKRQVPGRLVVRRIPDLNAVPGQESLFESWRFHAFFTTTDPALLDTVAADKIHRGHAIIETVHADLKNSALAHLPSGKFTANAAWLVLAVLAFNLTRAAATITGSELAKAATATVRRTLINISARVASSARTLRLHLPRAWPWESSWSTLFAQTCGPPQSPRT